VTAKSELVRLALARRGHGEQPAVVIDRQARLPGRGAYLCTDAGQTPSASCLQLALKRGGIARTLRCTAKIDSSDLLESVGQ
jgi:predicted RNA-binding protein YlxR (DUF448 family)